MAEKIRVLYIDDESTLVELGKMYLERSGNFIVTTSLSAPEAIRILGQERFDAIISDYQMPEMDGIEFLKVVRARGDKTPFVIFTGKGREEIAIKAFENGADFYVQKGGEPKAQFAELAHKILSAVQHRIDEKALLESEERFRALVENTSDVIRILNREGRIVFETAAGRELGYPPGYFLGRYPYEFIHPDDLAVMKQDLSEVYAKTSTSVPTEFRIRKADGSYVWVESVGKNLIGVPGVDGVVITTRFIDERKKADEARRESEEKFRQLFSKMPSGVAIYEAVDDGEDFIFRDFNAAGEAIEHIKKENAIGRRVSEVFPGVKEFGLFSVFQRVWRTGKPEFFPSAVYRDAREPGTWRENWIYRLQTGEIVAIYNDITERKVSEQALTKSQSQLAEAMDLAHMVNWEFDVASGIFTFNDRFYALYGTTAEREGGYQMPAEVYAREFVHPDEVSLVANEVQNAITATDPNYTRQIEHRIIRRDGEIRYIIVRFGITKDAEGKTVKTHGANQDITDRKQIEYALRESEERYRVIVEDQTEFICRFTPDGRLTFVNDAYCRYFSLDKDRCLARPHSVILPPEDVQQMKQHLASLTPQNPVATIEHRIIMPSGEVHWQRWNDRAIFDQNSNVVEYQSVGRDITKYKLAEDALKIKERQLSSIFNNVSEILFFVSVEPDLRYRFISVNQRFLDSTGLSENQVVGRYVDEVIPEPSLSLVLENYKQAIRENKIVRWFEVTPYPSGTKYAHVAVTPIFDGNNRCTNLIGNVHDITELKMAEEELRRSEERYRSLTESSPDQIFIINRDDTLQYVNLQAAKLFNLPLDQILGKPRTSLFPPEIATAQGVLLKKVFETGKPLRQEETIRFGNVTLWIDTSFVPLKDEKGNVHSVLGVSRDITERKRAEEALRVANEKYSKAFLSAPDAITISELDSGRFIEVNDAATRIFGYSRDELLGKSALELGIIINKEDREHLIDQVRKNGKVSQFEILERRKSGELYYALVNADTLSIENIPHLITTVRDITDRKQIEEALRESSRKLQEAQEMAHLGFWSWNIKTGHVEWSDEVFRIFGLDPKEFTPQIDSILALSPWPEDQQRDKELIRRAIESREPGTYEQRFLRPDNSTGYYYSTFRGRYDDGNNLISIVGTVLDITERKRVEEELQVTKEKYTKAFLSVPDAITISELESGRFIEVNDAASTLFGYTRDELIEKSGIDLGIWVNKEEREALIDQIKKEGRVVQFRVVERRKSGKLFDASITADTITIGNTRYLIAATRDITKRKQMEEALRESETRYKNIVDDQTEFISRFLPDGTHVFVNDAYCRYFKKTREEIIGHRFTPDIPEEDQKIVREHFQLLTPDNPVANVDHRIIMPDGSVRWQRWSDRAIFNNTGKIVEYQSVGRDITETKQIEIELKNSEHLRQDIIDHLPDPTFVINAQGTVIAWNKAMEELSGVPAREMVGKGNDEYALPFYGVRQPILIDLALHYNEEIWKKYDSIQRDGKTLVAETTNARPRGQTTVLWGKASPVYDENGKLIGAIETIRNVTERKQMEDGLRESEERYSSIFDNNYSVSLLIDPDTGKIVEANAAAVRYYGYSHDELTRLGIYDLNRLPKDKVVQDLQQAKHEKAKHFFSMHYLASGDKRNVEIYSGPITLQGRSHFYSIIHDITERKQAEEALALASKKLNLLSSITRHDLLNQLTVLRGYIDLSGEMLHDPVKLREFLEKEEKAAATIEEQITFTKEYQEMGVSAPSWQNVNAGIQKAQKQFLMRDVRVDVDCTALEVYADPLFEKVFYNLIDNALHYGGDGMRAIRVHCQESNTGLVVVCEDDGVGISAEDKKRLFTRGFGKNTGLGLFLCREILSITGITITENGTPGKGARFEITVPKGEYRFTGTGEK